MMLIAASVEMLFSSTATAKFFIKKSLIYLTQWNIISTGRLVASTRLSEPGERAGLYSMAQGARQLCH